MIEAVAEGKNPKLAGFLKATAPCVGMFISMLQALFPYIAMFCKGCYAVYNYLPTDLLEMILGLVFCFAGGLYPTFFAAIEAARLTGWVATSQAISDLFCEACSIREEMIADNKKDDDGDGIPDVDQIDGKALLMRKTNIFLTKCDPGKINTAVGGLYMSWIAVVASLKIQFARTITLALSIADMLQRPVDWIIAPSLIVIVPAEYRKWIPVILGWVTKSIAMSIAWYIQRVISAATSAVRGGLMAARALMKFCYRRGWNFGGLLPKDDEDTYIDEIAGFTLAALGFYIQFNFGFHMPFPLNWVFWPFEIMEYYIQWTITSNQ